MSDANLDGLVKVLYVIPEGEDDAGLSESMWALPLGDSLFELQNISVYAEHLNFADVVRCEESVDALPVICELVRASGHRTLRVIFREETQAEDAVDNVIIPLNENGITYERSAKRCYMFDVPPTSNYAWALELLRQKDAEGMLWLYEQ
jgi:hypothetical protein